MLCCVLSCVVLGRLSRPRVLTYELLFLVLTWQICVARRSGPGLNNERFQNVRTLCQDELDDAFEDAGASHLAPPKL